jgi:hypothetical protein
MGLGMRIYESLWPQNELNMLQDTTSHLTAAVSALYETLSEKENHAHLKVEDIAPDDLALLECVVRDVKFKAPPEIQPSNPRSHGR